MRCQKLYRMHPHTIVKLHCSFVAIPPVIGAGLLTGPSAVRIHFPHPGSLTCYQYTNGMRRKDCWRGRMHSHTSITTPYLFDFDSIRKQAQTLPIRRRNVNTSNVADVAERLPAAPTCAQYTWWADQQMAVDDRTVSPTLALRHFVGLVCHFTRANDDVSRNLVPVHFCRTSRSTFGLPARRPPVTVFTHSQSSANFV